MHVTVEPTGLTRLLVRLPPPLACASLFAAYPTRAASPGRAREKNFALGRCTTMKRFLLAALALFGAVTLPVCELAAQRRVVPFVGGGVATGNGNLSDDTDSGWLGYVGLDIPLSLTPGLSVGVTASYAHIPYKGSFNEATNIPG